MKLSSIQGEVRGSEHLLLKNPSFGRENKKPNASYSFVRRTTLASERNLFPRLLALIAAGLLFAAPSAQAKPKSVPPQTAVIYNTGSTNMSGYTVTVSLTGNTYHVASVFDNGNSHNSETGNHANLRLEVQRFFSDLNAAMPLTSLPVRHGMRSASFGTATYVTYKGQKSPDLTSASDPRIVALKVDIAAMTGIVNTTNQPRRPMLKRFSN